MSEVTRINIPGEPVSNLASYITSAFPSLTRTAIEDGLRSVDRIEVGRVLTDLFLGIAGIQDQVTPEPLRLYFHKVLNPFPEYTNNRNLDETELAARLAKKQRREEDLRAAATALHDAFKSHQDLARLSAWNAKTARIVDFIAGTIAVENVLNVSRQEITDQYADWESQGRPRNFKFNFARIPLFNERLFFPFANLISAEDQFGKGETRWIFKTLMSFVEVSQKALYEMIISGHPTIETTKEASKGECDIFDAAREVAVGQTQNYWQNFNGLLKSLDNYAHVVQTEMSPDGIKIAKATIRKEIEHGAYFFERLFYNLRGGRGTFDRTLSRRFNSEYDDEHQLMFKVRFLAGSWLGGDVDGHKGKKAEHFMLEEIILRGQIARLYGEALNFLEERGAKISDPKYTDLKQRWAKIASDNAALDKLMSLNEKPDGDIVLSQSEFDEINASIYRSPTLDSDQSPVKFEEVVDEMERILEKAFRESEGEVKQDAIWVLRNVQTFKAHTAHREQRQDSGVHADVVTYMLTDPALGLPVNLSGDRATTINAILMAPLHEASRRGTAFLAGIDRTDLPDDNLREITKGNQRPITYHTLKRMQQALGSEGAAINVVIAEAKGAANYLEALFIQESVAKSDNPFRLKVVLLFEEYNTLNGIEDTIFDMLKHSAVRKHLLDLADGDPSKLKLEIQIAHSDNTKRAGTPASRASIDLAHHIQESLDKPENLATIRALFAPDGIDTSKLRLKLRYYEGKSSSHANRGGKRSHTAGVDANESHEDTKTMDQGGDWIMLMLKTNLQRRIAMHFSHVFKHLGRKYSGHGKSDRNSLIEEGVALAFNRTFPDFSGIYYNDDPNHRGHLAVHPIASIPINKIIGSGSRPGSKADSEPPVYDPDGRTVPFEMTQLRAISDVEFQFNAQAQAALHASRNLELYLYEVFTDPKHSHMMDELQKEANEYFGFAVDIFCHGSKTLTVDGATAFRKLSQISREVTDFIAYAGINDKLESLQRRLKLAESEHDVPVSKEIQLLLEEMLTDSTAGIQTILKHFNCDAPDITGEGDPFRAYVLLRNALEEGPLSGAMPEVDLKQRIALLPQIVRDEVTSAAWKDGRRQPEDLTEVEKIILRNSRIAAMVADHGYNPDASDPALRATRHEIQRHTRGFIPEFAAE